MKLRATLSFLLAEAGYRMGRELNPDDHNLIREAEFLILKRAEYGRHHVACAIKTTDGQIFLGLHLSANIGVGSICAEMAAIAEAQKFEYKLIEKIVAVRHTFQSEKSIEVVSPCGQCRQFILEYGPEAMVIVNTTKGLVLTRIQDLLPLPFYRRQR